MDIVQLRESVEAKAEEVRLLLDESKAEEAKKSMDELRNLKTKLKDAEKLEEEEKRDLENQRDKKEGKEMMGELRMITKDNVSKLYKSEDKLDLGKYVRGAITGDWEGAGAEQNEYRALSTTTGKVIIPKSLSANILAEIMNKSLIYGSVPVVEMSSNNLTIAKATNPVFGFKEELGVVTVQDTTFEGVELKSKTVYGLMQVSLETLHSAQNLEDVLKQAMGNAIADAIDKACLYGTGATEIKGLIPNVDINSVESTKIGYADVVNAIGKVRAANGEPTILGVNADIDTALNLLTNTVGDPLQIPPVVNKLDRKISNQLKTDITDGADAIVFDPKSMIVGQQVQLSLSVSESKGFEDGSVWLRIYSMLDMAVVRPEHITKITGLK